MAISLKCHSCGKQVRAKDTSAGKKVKCPACGTVLHVPDAESYAAEVEEPAPPGHPARTKGAQSGGSKGWVAVVGGLVGMLVMAGGFFWWTGREALVPDEHPIARTAEQPTPVTAPSPVPPATDPPPQPTAPPDVPAPEKEKVAIAAIDPNEVIAKITVTIHVGAGADLEEPVALDLGLGYRLWLHPVGHKLGEPPPRGAIPQDTTAKNKIAAGESALFTFLATGDPGQDQFRTTEHLLANTRVGDIVRVGFASPGTINWVLAGYEIAINDKPFAAGKPDAKAEDRDPGAKRLAELAGQMGPLEQVQSDMQQLVVANQLEEEDKTQLKDVLTKLAPMAREKTWLEGQLEGKYPWFQDTAFKSPADGKPVVSSARVTLLTFTDKKADTSNYVYARIGGHKYFVSAPDQPLTGQAGPQVFVLDLMAGPLTDADLRDWAVGMLGNAKHYDGAPDRWHGQRVQIEIDGQVRYDSEHSDPDRLSLLAVRLIPPAHLDKAGSLVIDKEIDQQVFLWDPTKGTGLDPATSTPLPPTPDGPDAPPPENPDQPLPAPDKPDQPLPAPDRPDQPPPAINRMAAAAAISRMAARRTGSVALADLPDPPPPGVPNQDAATFLAGGQQQSVPFNPSNPSQQGFGPIDPFGSFGPNFPNFFIGGIPSGGGLGLGGLINTFLSSFVPQLLPPVTPLIPPGVPPSVTPGSVRFTDGFLGDRPFYGAMGHVEAMRVRSVPTWSTWWKSGPTRLNL